MLAPFTIIGLALGVTLLVSLPRKYPALTTVTHLLTGCAAKATMTGSWTAVLR